MDDVKVPCYCVVGEQRLYIDKRWYSKGDVYEGAPHPALLNVRPQDRHLELIEDDDPPGLAKAAAKKAAAATKKAAGKAHGKSDEED